MEFPIEEPNIKFLRDKHVEFCYRCLLVLPERCEFLDSTRIVVAFFAISSLDRLNALDKIKKDHQILIEWIYSLQVTPNEKGDASSIDFGFRGSTTCIAGEDINSDLCDKAYIAMTYTALSTLITLGDDLSRVDKKNILNSLQKLQLPDGSFRPMNIDCESDMRFVYCAACICYILQDWTSIDVEKVVDFIKRSRNYDGGIGQGPGLESHGGSTFCAIATLSLMGKLESTFTKDELKNLKRWLAFRQYHGFHGRPNKPDDTCYTFWIGATLKLLGCYEFVNFPKVSTFVLSAQDEITGGIGKWLDCPPDLLHTSLGLSGLLLDAKATSLITPALNVSQEGLSGLSLDDEGTSLVHAALNISQRAASYLHKLHEEWKLQS